MGRILAIDVGQKRYGLAVTDPLQIIATPLDTINANDIFSYLADYIKNEEVETIVVGDARTLDNKPSDSSKFINPFVKKLQKTYPAIPIARIDERFTSVLAQRAIIDAGIKKKKRQNKSLVDKVSATLILQSYLHQKTNLL